MKQRTIGNTGIKVSALGLGCMGMSDFYGAHDDGASIETMHRAIALGVTFFDTADVYGPFTNEQLVGRAIADRRSQVVLATKFGNVRDEKGTFLGINGRPEYVKQACDASLRRLGVDRIDLWQLHRIDPRTPREEQFGEIAAMQKEGLIRHVGLSEVSVDDVVEAQGYFDVVTVQNLYNVGNRSSEELLQHSVRNGIGFIPWFPLGNRSLLGEDGPVAGDGTAAGSCGGVEREHEHRWTIIATAPAQMSTTVTPAMRQYLDAKRQFRDAIVFFRMGDFYEMFYEDAIVAARALDLTLTSRSKDAGGNGIPASLKSQQQWFAELREECGHCHQVGSKITREITDNSVEGWAERITKERPKGDHVLGDHGHDFSTFMQNTMTSFGRVRALQMWGFEGCTVTMEADATCAAMAEAKVQPVPCVCGVLAPPAGA